MTEKGALTAMVHKRTAESEIADTTSAHFRSASVDGKVLTKGDDYTAVEGSVVVTLKPAYLSTLSAGTMDKVAVDAGSECTLPANKFTRSGYTFAGWNTKADGTGTAIKDKGTIKVTSDTVLYAQWTKASTASAAKKTSALAKTGDAASLAGVAATALAGATAVLAGGFENFV